MSVAGLEIKKNCKSPFGDYQRKNGRQMQKCSRQLVQEQKLRLEPHLISIVVRLLVDCGCSCGTDRNTQSWMTSNMKTRNKKTPEHFCMTNKQKTNKVIRTVEGYFGQEQLHLSHCTWEIVWCKGIKNQSNTADSHLVPANYENRSVYPSLVINNSWLSV